MSWSISGVWGDSVPEAKGKVRGAQNVPDTIKDYIESGIEGLRTLKGDDVRIYLTAHGHQCTGADYEVTSALIHLHDKAHQAAYVAATVPS